MPTLFAENLTKGQREAISLDDLAWPEERKYPVRNQRELDAAARLLGRAPQEKQAAIKARIIRIARRKGLSLPDAWKASMSTPRPEAARFAAADLNDSQVRDLIAQALTEAAEAEGARCLVQDVNRAKGTFTYLEYDPEGYGYQGELNQATFEIGDDYRVTLGEGQEVIQTSRYEPAPMDDEDEAEAAMMSRSVHTAYFALDGAATEAGEYVLRSGKVSEVGSYPDKGITFSDPDFEAAVSSFTPVAMDSEHGESLLDGALGTLRRVWRQGKELWGEIAIPKELDALFTRGKISRRVSLTWDRATKRIIGCAWAKYPRVGDAVVMSRDGLAPSGRGEPSPWPGGAGQRRAAPPTRGQEKSMNLVDKLKAFFKAEGIELDEETPTAGGSGVSKAEFDALRAELAALKAETATSAAFSDERLKAEAKAFATAAVTANKAVPAAFENICRAYFTAAQADRTAARFADGKMATPTLDAFKAMFADMEPHTLTREMIADIAESEEDAIFAMGPRTTGKPAQKMENLDAGAVMARRAAALNGKGA
jgi:hypothetical protein